MKYVAFDENHNIIEGPTLDWIITLAKQGKITEKGRKLVLIPDTRFGEKDSTGLREFANGQILNKGRKSERRMKRIYKKDCIPLLNLVPSHLKGTETKGYRVRFDGTR